MCNVYGVLGGYCNLKSSWIQGDALTSPNSPPPLNKNNKKMKLHTQRGQFVRDISAILHGIEMGVCFNENGTSKCSSGAKYICIPVLRVTQGSYCVVPENIHTPPTEGHWKLQGGGGFKGRNFRGEWGVHRKLLFQRVKKHEKIESNARLIPSTK